ncbi:MAG: hypothetical protein VW421_01410 [Gammaproteobacteria bacterium]
MRRLYLNTGSFEFISRFLTWARVLALGALVPVDGYGFILVLLGIEGLLASVVAYPSVKDVLVRQDISVSVFRHFFLLFCIIALPVFFILLWVTDFSMLPTFVAIIAALLNGLSQVGLYMLRVCDLSICNRTKIIWAFTTTAVMMVALPIHWALLPLVYVVGMIPIVASLVSFLRAPPFESAFVPVSGYHARGWVIYGTQALLNNFPQYGVRLFIAGNMALSNVVAYTQTYMVSTAVFFGFSAIMLVLEPKLSRAGSDKEIAARLPLVLRVSAIFVLLTFGYAILISVVGRSEFYTDLVGTLIFIDQRLLLPIMVFVALNGVFTVVNCMVLAGFGRTISLLSTALGSATLLISLVISLPEPTLFGVGVAIALSQGVSLAVLIIFLMRRFVKTDGLL